MMRKIEDMIAIKETAKRTAERLFERVSIVGGSPTIIIATDEVLELAHCLARLGEIVGDHLRTLAGGSPDPNGAASTLGAPTLGDLAALGNDVVSMGVAECAVINALIEFKKRKESVIDRVQGLTTRAVAANRVSSDDDGELS